MVYFQIDAFLPTENRTLPDKVISMSGTDFKKVAKDILKAVFLFTETENYHFDVHYCIADEKRNTIIKSWYLLKSLKFI